MPARQIYGCIIWLFVSDSDAPNDFSTISAFMDCYKSPIYRDLHIDIGLAFNL
jgi:hypothetical protein